MFKHTQRQVSNFQLRFSWLSPRFALCSLESCDGQVVEYFKSAPHENCGFFCGWFSMCMKISKKKIMCFLTLKI